MKRILPGSTVPSAMLRRFLLMSILSAAALPASAQAPLRTPAYEPLLVAEPAKPDLSALETLAAIRQAAASKDEKRLADLLTPDFAALSCSADPTTSCPPRKAVSQARGRTPLERLKLALCCGGRDDPAVSPADRADSMFGVLASLLDGGAAAGSETVCQPALPQFDRARLATLAKRLDVDASTMRIAASPVTAQAQPEPAAAIAATLPKGAILPLLTTSSTPAPGGWTVLALPGGGVGYAEGVVLDELAPEAACVRRTKAGWRLAVLIGRQS